ncbi:MAG: family 10 glycosylhydrolase, partial [Ignavibacteriaceae bacterium]|nr:family 10 glycosylhydrolase [Ignavibacteriaceae bacterium]
MTIIFKHNFVPSQKAAPYRQTQGLNYKSILSITLILIFSLFSSLFPQSLSPKREFRGIWIATLENIDWPSANNLSSEQQKKEFITIINRLQKDKFNAVFIQIRPSSDALYESSIEPWSEWLTGKQGRSPSPDYDPLSFMIDECHKRGIEIHAWFNPFRSVMNIHTSNISPQHVSIRHPDWNVTYGEYKWLNPGLPEVRNYVLKIVMDVVRRYPVDGVHFDDYFYPYPQKNIKFNDAGTFARYSRGIKKLTDWRRDNINLFVKSVSDSIRKVKPGLKFGISPPGVWKNKSGDFAGSYTAASESFNSNYADSRKWLKEGWIDYLVPQLYWHIGNFHADYQILTDWWNENAYGKNIYIGQSAYKIGTDNNHEWSDPSQLPSQIKLNRLLNNIKGNVFFNTNSVLKNPLGFEDSLRNNYYKYFALTPNINNNINSLPQPPLDPAYKNVNGQILLSWNMHLKNLNNDTASYFVIYSFDQNDKIDIAQGEKIAAVLYGSETSWLDSRRKINPSGKTYIITAIDKYGNESNDKCRITI